jgi:hypothetical protein
LAQRVLLAPLELQEKEVLQELQVLQEQQARLAQLVLQEQRAQEV